MRVPESSEGVLLPDSESSLHSVLGIQSPGKRRAAEEAGAWAPQDSLHNTVRRNTCPSGLNENCTQSMHGGHGK